MLIGELTTLSSVLFWGPVHGSHVLYNVKWGAQIERAKEEKLVFSLSLFSSKDESHDGGGKKRWHMRYMILCVLFWLKARSDFHWWGRHSEVGDAIPAPQGWPRNAAATNNLVRADRYLAKSKAFFNGCVRDFYWILFFFLRESF